MKIFLQSLFSGSLIKRGEDSSELTDVVTINFWWFRFCSLRLCSTEAVKNSEKANPPKPSTMRTMPTNACQGSRYCCTIQSTMTDVGIARIVPILCVNDNESHNKNKNECRCVMGNVIRHVSGIYCYYCLWHENIANSQDPDLSLISGWIYHSKVNHSYSFLLC